MENEILQSNFISHELRELMVKRILMEQLLNEISEDIDYEMGFAN